MPTVKQGAIGFGTMVMSVIGLDEYDTYLTLYINFYDTIQFEPQQTTGTFAALERGTLEFRGADVAEKYMVLITDGRSDNPSATTAVC